MYTILDHDKFSPSTKGIFNPENGYYRLGGRANMTCKQNPTPNELRAGIYKPRLTVTKRMTRNGTFETPLKIEFSVPKLIFGNNFDELTDEDFITVINKLKAVLRDMGVYVYETALVNAPVSSVHFSKNIPLTDYTTPYTYLDQLSKLNINKRLDTNKTDYRNEGHSFKYRANSFEIVFYDKIKDLSQAKNSEKRAEEKDNALQLNIFGLAEQKYPFEVLRIEIRLNKRQKINQILGKIDKKVEPTFANLFKQETAKAVLLHFIKEVEDAYPPLLTYRYNSPKKLFTELLASNPCIKLTTALKFLGFRILLEELGVREFREVIKRFGNSAWYALDKETKLVSRGKDTNAFSLLRKNITEFQPLKLSNFKGKMINSDKQD